MANLMLPQAHTISRDNGLGMPGYFVWGGSVIKAEGLYWMFASRWPDDSERLGENILDGYRSASEIVLAASVDPEGPYEMRSVIVGKRDANFWDSQMAHNPYILRIEDRYVLFYIGIRQGDIRRKVGYAASDKIDGPYKRSDSEIILTDDANNPAPFVSQNGRIGLMFRDRDLHVYTAEGESYDKPFSIVGDDIFPDAKLEDFCIYHWDGKFHMICEDNRGSVGGQWRWGVHFISPDGLCDWKKAEPLHVYDHQIQYDDGSTTTLDRRERPQLLFDDNGTITHLITLALKDRQSRCLVVPV